MRKTIVFDHKNLIGKGKWLHLHGFRTPSGYREVVARKNGHFRSAKCMVLYVEEELWDESQAKNSSDLPSFLQNLRRIGLQNLWVFFLASDKPCTYPKSPELEGLTENYQLEIPGGVADAVDEQAIANGLREATEEYGCSATDIAMTAPLLTSVYAANDAGGNVEFYSTCTTLVTKKPAPPRKEGVIPEKCALVPLLEAENFLIEQGKKGILLEWLALASLCQLGLELCGGWASLA